jgi:ribosome maturation factor RimP
MAAARADLRDRLVALVEPELRLHEVELVELELLPGGRRLTLRFSVEELCPPGVEAPEAPRITLDECAQMSRILGRVLDAADQGEDEFLPRGYVVEVSSPGIFRRLSKPEHFRRYVGERVRATLTDTEDPERSVELRGRLASVNEEAVEIVDDDGSEQHVELSRIRRAHLDPELDYRAGRERRAKRSRASD